MNLNFEEKTGVKPDELLLGGQPVELYPQGYSMYPLFIPGRDSVVLYPLDETADGDRAFNGRKIKVNDVIVFRRPGSILVIHRVYRKTDSDHYYFVGDNQSEKEIEGPVSASQFVGILTEIHKNGRHVIKCSNICYRAAERIWLWLMPVRPQISAFLAFVKKIFKHQ